MNKRLYLVHGLTTAAPLLCALLALASGPIPYLHAPSVTTYARHDPAGTTILPTGRYLRPAGRHTPLARWPHGMALSPDGSTLFVASKGVGQFVTGWESSHPDVALCDPGEGRTNGGAAVFSADGKTLYWSSGD